MSAIAKSGKLYRCTLRSDFRLSFFNAALMPDPEGILKSHAPSTRFSGMVRFTDNTRSASMAASLSACL